MERAEARKVKAGPGGSGWRHPVSPKGIKRGRGGAAEEKRGSVVLQAHAARSGVRPPGAWLLPGAWPHPAWLCLELGVGFWSRQPGPWAPGGPKRGVRAARASQACLRGLCLRTAPGGRGSWVLCRPEVPCARRYTGTAKHKRPLPYWEKVFSRLPVCLAQLPGSLWHHHVSEPPWQLCG